MLFSVESTYRLSSNLLQSILKENKKKVPSTSSELHLSVVGVAPASGDPSKSLIITPPASGSDNVTADTSPAALHRTI